MSKVKLFEYYGDNSPYYIIDIKIGFKTIYKALNCYLYKEDKTIHIGGLYVGGYNNYKYINKGYGTKIMNCLIKFAQDNGYEQIIGELIDSDSDHRDRQIHFYKKFGFIISPPDEENDCLIKLYV
jgi:GNAT superfamily N-acetyltransferase